MMDMILTNARLVLDDEIINDGTLVAGADGMEIEGPYGGPRA